MDLDKFRNEFTEEGLLWRGRGLEGYGVRTSGMNWEEKEKTVIMNSGRFYEVLNEQITNGERLSYIRGTPSLETGNRTSDDTGYTFEQTVSSPRAIYKQLTYLPFKRQV